MVFSRKIRAANGTARGEAQTHQTLRKSGKAPGICIVLYSNAQLAVSIMPLRSTPSKVNERYGDFRALQRLGFTKTQSSRSEIENA